jgi:hypothetical protein
MGDVACPDDLGPCCAHESRAALMQHDVTKVQIEEPEMTNISLAGYPFPVALALGQNRLEFSACGLRACLPRV